MDWKLELVVVPVTDVDRAKSFYADKLGFHLDADTQPTKTTRVVRMTPPGSACSIVIGPALVAADADRGSGAMLRLVVADIEAARAQLVERGVEVSEVQTLDPRDGEFVFFSDLDGNSWAVQEPLPFVPEDTTLPFFAYGLFKPGEPLHQYVEPFLEDRPIPGRVRGSLCVRDGLPLLKDDSARTVDGYVIRFRPGKGNDGYAAIGSREPRKQYRWKILELTEPPGLQANVLVGHRPGTGSVDYEGTGWRSGDDAVLRDGLALVRRIADEHGSRRFASAPPEWFDWDRLFRLQMGYLFLWTVIERYAALAYGPELEPGQKVKALGEDPLFGKILSATTRRSDQLFDSRDPTKSVRLNAGNPKTSARYYFQVRNNLTHRGKGAWQDGEKVRLSLLELLTIVERMVDQTPGLTAREPLL